MIVFVGGVIFCIFIYYHAGTFAILFRLIKKYIFAKKYQVPERSIFDFPLPPFPNSWYPVCLTSEIKENQKYTFRIASNDILLYRSKVDSTIQCIPRYCPHMGVDLKYGCIKSNCIKCPFHGKHVSPKTENTFSIEEANGIVFIWIGSVHNEFPPISIKKLMKQNSMEDCSIFSYLTFQHNVGGHLVDYAEHLLDICHAPYIHNTEIKPIENGLKTNKYSFSTSFKIEKENSVFIPIFTYATPSFGNIEYTKYGNVFIMFIVNDVGNIQMNIIPGWKGYFTLQKFFTSLAFSIYTYIDFLDEAVYFTTKDHNKRNLNKNEEAISHFRKWFINTYFSKDQLKSFETQKEKYYKMNLINDW